MATEMTDSTTVPAYNLQCMDIWSGNQSVTSDVVTPGLELSVYSRPYRGESRGGDVHYVSLCASGFITRMLLADVSGHGEAVAETSQQLRALVRRFMNSSSQTRLVRELNREFTALTKSARFATAIVATYLANDSRLVLCNAGHPRPLWYQHRIGKWSYVNQDLIEDGRVANLPLGFDSSTNYQQFSLKMEEGDLFLLYTDALTETRNRDDKLLGETGLLNLVQSIPITNVRDLSQRILAGLDQYSENRPADDDVTLLVLRYNKSGWRFPSVGEKLNAYAKLLRLKPA